MCQPRMLNTEQASSGHRSLRAGRTRSPVAAAIRRSPVAPAPTLSERNHHTGSSARAIFMPGQFSPQNRPSETSRR